MIYSMLLYKIIYTTVNRTHYIIKYESKCIIHNLY